MIAAVLASGLLWAAADGINVDVYAAQLRATKEAYRHCIFRRASEMYRGVDNADLQNAIMKACRAELDAYEQVVTAYATPGGGAAAVAVFESANPALVKGAIRFEALCAKEAEHLSAEDRSLCVDGGE